MKPALLVPQVSIGEIKLQDDIENYADRQFEYTNFILKIPYHCYPFCQNPVLAYVDENGRIESVHCEVECLWRGVNLIGINIEDFENLAAQSHSCEVDHIWLATENGEQLQDVYEYDELGLQIWVFGAAIVTVIVCDYRD